MYVAFVIDKNLYILDEVGLRCRSKPSGRSWCVWSAMIVLSESVDWCLNQLISSSLIEFELVNFVVNNI